MSIKSLVTMVDSSGSAIATATVPDPYFNNVSLLLSGGDTADDPNYASVSLLLTGNSLLDSSNNKFTMTSTNTVSVSTSVKKFGYGSLSYPAAGTFLTSATSTAAFNFGTGDFTIEGWFYKIGNAGNGNNTLFSIGQYTDGILFRDNAGDGFYLGGSSTNLNLTTLISLSTWFHIALVRASGNVTVYLNGTSVHTRTYSSALNPAEAKVWVGAAAHSPSNEGWYGYIDDFRITKGVARYTANFVIPSKAYPAAEIADVSNNGLPITQVNTPIIDTTIKKYGASSIYFNGAPRLDIPDNPVLNFGTGDFTIELWAYTTTTTASQTFLAKWNGGVGYGILLYPTLRFMDNTGASIAADAASWVTSTWTHIAVCRIGGIATLYKNGVSVASGADTRDYSSTSVLCIGSLDQSNNYRVTGYIDDLRITKGVARYVSNFTPPGIDPTVAPTSATTYVDDVFSTYSYIGNGGAQTINNGINLAGYGGMVWIKQRSGAEAHRIFDTSRGPNKYMSSNTTTNQVDNPPFELSAFYSNGFKVGDATGAASGVNANAATYTSWTFRKAPKFFDVVTYTGDGTSNRIIPHTLGAAPGLVILKSTDVTGDWTVRCYGTESGSYYPASYYNSTLNGTGAFSSLSGLAQESMTSWTTGIKLDHRPANSIISNTLNAKYVLYIFGHDTSSTGMIRTGSYIGNGSATGPIVDLGWEPQFIMIKIASSYGSWQILDNMRGIPTGSSDATLQANASTAEAAAEYVSLLPNGFQIMSTSSEVNTSTATYVYVAIRRPNKPPSNGTQVFNIVARTGTGAAATVTTGVTTDLSIIRDRGSVSTGLLFDRLRGAPLSLTTVSTAAEDSSNTDTLTSFASNTGFALGASTTQNVNQSGVNYVNWAFKRAPGFMDIVCWVGDATYNRNVPHNLATVPELIFCKPRDRSENWMVFHKDHVGYYLILNAVDLRATDWSTLTCTLSNLIVSTTGLSSPNANSSTYKYIAYLFATLAGVSKVGSYTGNGTSLTVNCSFATGARFVMIKRTNAVGDWYVWDSTRGIIGANDPHLSLNTTAAEVTTDDSIDPDNTGFIVNQVAATNVNVTSATYIFLAIA